MILTFSNSQTTKTIFRFYYFQCRINFKDGDQNFVNFKNKCYKQNKFIKEKNESHPPKV